MEIIIKKFENKPSTMRITRNDGSSTWSKLHKGTESHDLGHFAVESVLGFKQAFFGIINEGYEISDFEAPREDRPEAVRPKNLHPEALITEHLVNLLQIELMNSGGIKNFLTEVNTILIDNNLSIPSDLDEISLNEIRDVFIDLVRKWSVLGFGEELKLELAL